MNQRVVSDASDRFNRHVSRHTSSQFPPFDVAAVAIDDDDERLKSVRGLAKTHQTKPNTYALH